MSMNDIVRQIQSTPDCRLFPPIGLPTIDPKYVLPSDLNDFYELCGGARLFQSSGLPMSIIPPDEFVIAHETIFSDVASESMNSMRDDISWSWYLIGDAKDDSQYITIDLNKERFGYCYDSFWDRHPYDSRIIAKSFSDLLLNLLIAQGKFTFWLQQGFADLGSPYDS